MRTIEGPVGFAAVLERLAEARRADNPDCTCEVTTGGEQAKLVNCSLHQRLAQVTFSGDFLKKV